MSPLTNRTVDLLLTMANQPVPAMAVYGLSRLNTGSRQRRLAQTSPAWLHSAPPDSPPRDDLLMTRRIFEIPWIKHAFDNRGRPGPSRGTLHRLAGRTGTPLARLTAVRSGGASRGAVAALRCGPPALPRPGRAGVRRGYR